MFIYFNSRLTQLARIRESPTIIMKEHLRDYFPERFEHTGVKTDWLKDVFERTELQKAKCQVQVAEVFRKSNEIKLLVGAMRRYGCHFSLSRHVSVEKCNNCAGGFDPDTNQIVICSTGNSLSANRILTTLMHEMIHMFDYCRASFDYNNLEHVACSEIRAANLTFCSMADKFQYGGSKLLEFKKTHQLCVKEVAFKSVKAYSPETEDDKLWDVVDKVFPGCYNDLEPFGRRPTSGMKDLKHSFRERYYYGYA